jgi:hypothetical protein
MANLIGILGSDKIEAPLLAQPLENKSSFPCARGIGENPWTY